MTRNANSDTSKVQNYNIVALCCILSWLAGLTYDAVLRRCAVAQQRNTAHIYPPDGVWGGGILACSGNVIVSDFNFSCNFAWYGGAISICEYGATLTMTNSTFYNNSAQLGFGIQNDRAGATLTVTNSTFDNNSATLPGWDTICGGIYSAYGRATFTNTTLTRNSATWGGGILNSKRMMDVTNSTIPGNSASWAAASGMTAGRP
jgi:hypothetical protein